MPADAGHSPITLRQLKLRPKTLLQTLRHGDPSTGIEWQFCAAIEGKGLMLAPPPGQKMPAMTAGASYFVQGFTGQYDFSFDADVVGTFDAPFAYTLLSWPETVKARLVRQALRVPTLLPAQLSALAGQKGEPQSASVLDLTASGALLEVLHPVGRVGDALRISFVVEADGEKVQINTDALLCHCSRLEHPSRERIGLSFKPLRKTERLMLSAYLRDLAEALEGS